MFGRFYEIYICNKLKNNMDRSYLDDELNKIGLLEFENEMRDPALKVFDSNAECISLSENERIRLKELLFSCTYGTMKERWIRQVWHMQPGADKVSVPIKLRYLARCLFPDKTYLENWCQEYEPFIAQHRWLMPVAPIWRIVKRGVEKRKQVKKEFDTIRKA